MVRCSISRGRTRREAGYSSVCGNPHARSTGSPETNLFRRPAGSASLPYDRRCSRSTTFSCAQANPPSRERISLRRWSRSFLVARPYIYRSGHPIDNAFLADELERFAGLLDLWDANRYAIRAYRRAAASIRASPVPVADLLREGRVRELRGIGPGVEARLRELVETGQLQELIDLRRAARPELIGLAQQLGLRTSRMIEICDALGVATAGEFRQAGESGALLSVPGIGPKTQAKLLEALRRPPPSRVLTLPVAGELCRQVAERMGGTVAGDVRRWRDECTNLSVVVASDDMASTIDRFAECPQILALAECSEAAHWA